ncbi:MAG: hypothetical protein LBF69_05375 [Prevotellaceae bacterium]|jgi:hypothetical protein|nr:hypothetical protein [Prevotellaceae bacterium]
MEKQTLNISCKCSEVTLDEFIDCLINSNLRRLVRSGSPTDTELQAAWSALYQDYMKQCAGEKNKYLFALYKRTAVLQARLKAATTILNEALPDDEKIEFLKQVDYSGNIDSIVAKIQRDTVILSGAINELNAAKSGGSEDGMTESDFTRWIVSVSKFMGYRIDRHEVTVSEFLEMNREWEETAKAKAKLKQKN